MADSEDAHPTLPPAHPASEAAEGSSSRRSSTAPGGGDLDLEPSAARKHGLDTSLILNEPRKRAKRESVEGVGVPLGQGKGKRKESQQQIDEPAYVLDKGMRLLDAVRDATEGASPAGRLIATDFLKLPNKRLYPDYYEVIKQPVALDDVEAKIKAGEYPSFDAVRADVEHCFVNAKRYNAKGSVIFNDAKVLHKLAKTTYAQLVPPDHPDYKAPAAVPPAHAPTAPQPPSSTTAAAPPPPATASSSTEAAAAASPAPAPPAAGSKKAQNQHTKRKEAEDKARQLAAEAEAARAKAEGSKPEKKAKAPDVWKVVKNKLDKTTQMKEKDTGRVLAFEFMDLIPKSQYPDYYKIVKKPMSFNLIYQKLKRRDYESVDELADDVDLIFSNALVFNMDESQIAIDAMALKQRFHSLVDDMISEGHSAPKGQAKATLPAPTAGSSSMSAPNKAAGAAGSAEAPASIAKIKIKKKAKTEGASDDSTLPDAGPSQPPPAPAPQETAGGSQPMDVDQPGSAAAGASGSLDPASLAALQQLVSSGILDVGMQQAANADPSVPPAAGQTGTSMPPGSGLPTSIEASAVPEKKVTRKEQRQLARDLKAEKKAGLEAAKAAPPTGPPPPLQPQQQLQQAARPSHSPVPVQQMRPTPPLPPSQQQAPAAPSPAMAAASAANVPAPPVKVKMPSVLAALIVRFPGSDRREIRMRNDRGIKAHALSIVSEQEVALVMDVRDLNKGKGRELNGDAAAADTEVGSGTALQLNGDGDVDMAAAAPDVDGLLNGGGHAQALPPPPGPPKRLFAIGVTSNSVPVESFPPSLRRMPSNPHQPPADEAFVADPPLAFNLSLSASGALGRAGTIAGSGAWIVEVAVRWRDVDEQTGAVIEQGQEAYELFLRR